MNVMNYMLYLVLLSIVFCVVSMGMAFVPYRGVISLIGVSFFCCVYMVMLGRTFVALVVYIVYLGGLVVVFGYCVSVEKDEADVFKFNGFKYFVILMVVIVFLLGLLMDGGLGLLFYFSWEEFLCMEVNGGGVFYFDGGVGLIICSWGLLVVLFSVLVVLSWSRLGGLRPF